MEGAEELGGSFPEWAVEPVRLVEHDPAWARRAEGFAGEVRELFGRYLIGDVVHVGSTAIPGLPAKPIIDLQSVAADPVKAVTAAGVAAEAASWMLVPRELDQQPWRWLFVRVDSQGCSRLAHLHLMPPGQARWDEQLHFRDQLRLSAELRAEYAALKQRLAVDHHDDREAYTAAKSAFVRRVTAG
ncbi:GrpB family protein [Actinomycetospora sp. NBC_00405]|uniref:GrpB family protein n=1 Tax=Actinomycetospora sp. NBC_00405 TaxID=2975952 RepID=UPI002E1D9187